MLPQYIVPMEPESAQEPPKDPRYLHSIKWDGVRGVVYVTSKGVRIHNRRLFDRTSTYPELHSITEILKVEDVVLDGEIIALDQNAKPSFWHVMKRDRIKSEEKAKKMMQKIPVYYMIFDILYIKGESVMNRPLGERLELLREVVSEDSRRFHIVEVEECGSSLFERVRRLELEGVVSKERDSLYYPGIKSRKWIKSKYYKKINVVVGGFSTKEGRINSLCVGAYSENQLVYLGNVSSGLSCSEFLELDRELRKLEQPHSPFENFSPKGKGYHWVVPLLCLRVKYLEITPEGRLRSPSVVGFLKKDPQECRL